MNAELDTTAPLPEVMRQIVAFAEEAHRNTDSGEALNQERRAQIVADLLKAERAARDLRIAATRLQVIAMRQVALLGSSDRLAKHKREAALAFAALSEDEFEKALDGITTITDPATVYRLVRHSMVVEEAQRITGIRFQDLFHCWTPTRKVETDKALEFDSEDLRSAFETLLSGPPYSDEPFTIAEIAADAARKLEAETGSRVWQNGAVQQLLNEAARRNVMVGPRDEYGIPEFLTVHDKELGWVRVPTSIALLAHLKAHALVRRQQLMQIENRVKELDKTIRNLERRLEPGEGDDVLLADLLDRDEQRAVA